ncbi:hypothetical protein [Aquabacterium sp.]
MSTALAATRHGLLLAGTWLIGLREWLALSLARRHDRRRLPH